MKRPTWCYLTLRLLSGALVVLSSSGCVSSILQHDLTELTDADPLPFRELQEGASIGSIQLTDLLVLRLDSGQRFGVDLELASEEVPPLKIYDERFEVRIPVGLMAGYNRLAIIRNEDVVKIPYAIEPGETSRSDFENDLKEQGLFAGLEPRPSTRVLPGDRVRMRRISEVVGGANGGQWQIAEIHDVRVDALGRLPLPAVHQASKLWVLNFKTPPLRGAFSSLERHAFDVRAWTRAACWAEQPTLDEIEDCLASAWDEDASGSEAEACLAMGVLRDVLPKPEHLRNIRYRLEGEQSWTLVDWRGRLHTLPYVPEISIAEAVHQAHKLRAGWDLSVDRGLRRGVYLTVFPHPEHCQEEARPFFAKFDGSDSTLWHRVVLLPGDVVHVTRHRPKTRRLSGRSR